LFILHLFVKLSNFYLVQEGMRYHKSCEPCHEAHKLCTYKISGTCSRPKRRNRSRNHFNNL